MYTRWGRKTCPSTGAQLLYEGIAGGSYYLHHGGGANYVCLPKVPQYMTSVVSSIGDSMHGVEYEHVNGVFPGKHNHNVPCAVCELTTRGKVLMIPAKTSCPMPPPGPGSTMVTSCLLMPMGIIVGRRMNVWIITKKLLLVLKHSQVELCSTTLRRAVILACVVLPISQLWHSTVLFAPTNYMT